MSTIQDLLPILIPVVLTQWTLAIVAFIHVLRHPNYRFGNRIMWILIVLFIQFVGPIVYFLFGRGEDE